MDSTSSSYYTSLVHSRYIRIQPIIDRIRPIIYFIINSREFRYIIHLLSFFFTIPESFSAPSADYPDMSSRQSPINMEDISLSQASTVAANAAASANNYFPHFISTMIMIYFIGSGPVSIVIVLCISAIAAALILRDPLLSTPLFPSTNLQSPEDVKAFALGYRKGFADAKEEDRGECRRRRSGEGGTTATGRRLMGPPVVGEFSDFPLDVKILMRSGTDQATTRLHQMHPHVVMNMQGADGQYEGVIFDRYQGM